MGPIEQFLAALPHPVHTARARLESWLGEHFRGLVMAFPDVRLDLGAFAVHLARQVGESGDVLAALEAVHLHDLFLAWACGQHDRAALSRLEREHLARVRDWARGADATEVEQTVRVRLLVSEPGSPARITQYTGRGPLAAWVRMIATRTVIDLTRSARPDREHADLASLSTPIDPEIDYLKVRYASQCRAALERAIRALPAREASLLKLCYLENASASAIGRMYSVSARTAQRWLSDAREHLLEQTRRALGEMLSLEPSELESLMLLVHSRLHITLQRVFESGPVPAEARPLRQSDRPE